MTDTARIYYTIGDTLYIAGVCSGNNLPALPWTSATAVISIRMVGGDIIVNRASATLTAATGAYVYNGGTAAITIAAEYEYEIEVTFQDGSKQTFPWKEKAPLTVIAQIA